MKEHVHIPPAARGSRPHTKGMQERPERILDGCLFVPPRITVTRLGAGLKAITGKNVITAAVA